MQEAKLICFIATNPVSIERENDFFVYGGIVIDAAVPNRYLPQSNGYVLRQA